MRIVKPSFEIIEQLPNLKGIYKQIELAGRTCYKSHDKMTEDSAKNFVDRMIKSGHGAMLEHGTVYLKYESELVRGIQECDIIFNKYKNNKFSIYNTSRIEKRNETIIGGYVTTNLRVLVENDWLDDLQYICEPTEYHERRVTVKFICSRSTSHQIVRHRSMSFAQESQRYCNYSLDKFNNEITFIAPAWYKEEIHHKFLNSLHRSEMDYFDLINSGLKPQEARAVLPNSCKTELIVTGFISDWKALFDLRCETGADPDIKEIMIPLKEEFIKLGFL